MIKSKFEDFLYFLKNKRILITSHDVVDLDGFSSVIALEFFLNQYFENLKANLYFYGISNSTNSFIDNFVNKFPDFNLDLVDSVENLEIDAIIVLDANKLHQITLPDKFKNNNDISYFFIDHHYIEENQLENSFSQQKIVLDHYSSTAELVYNIFKDYNISIPEPIRYLLIGGILTDSGYFKYGNNNTIRTVGELLTDNIHYQDILLMLSSEIDVSEKIAKIKGVQRTELIKEGNWLIGVSHVSSFEGSVANTMTRIGFDIAIVISDQDTEYRLSLRARKKVCLLTGLHLGKILEDISVIYDVNGGGHDGAAGISIKKELGDLREIILERIKDVLANNENKK